MDSCGICGIIVYKVTDLWWVVMTYISTDPCTWMTFWVACTFLINFSGADFHSYLKF